MVRQTQNCGYAVLKRIDELLDRSNVLSKDKKAFLTGTISSILRQIRHLFTDKSRSDIRERVSMIKQDSFKNSSGFLSSNPMVAADSRDTSRMGRKDMSTKSAKSGKSGKSSKSGRSSKDAFDADDRANGTPISNTQLEQSMRFVTTFDSSNSCHKLCGQLIAVLLKIFTQKPPGNNSTININTVSNNNNNSSSASLRPSSSEQSSKSKQKGKAWDNLLAFEKFLVDEICCFLSEVGGGSGLLPEKWGDALGSIAMQYWRVCDGESIVFEFALFQHSRLHTL